MEGRGPSAPRRDQNWSENTQDNWADRHNAEEKVKKEKKWSIGKLFRRKKKDTGSESSDSSNDNSQKQKKSHSKKRESGRNNADHITSNQSKRSQSVTKYQKKEYPDEGVLSDPSAGFVGYVGRGLPRSPFDRSHFTSKDSIERKGAGSSTGSHDGSLRKGRKGRIKARVEAIRNSKNESSSDEESQKSTSSSILKFRSDDSLANHSKDGSIGRRTRSARTDRYIKRLSRDDEVQLNREADLIQKGFSRSDAELMALKHRVLSTPQMIDHERNAEEPDYSEPHVVLQAYSTRRSESGSQVPAYANVTRTDVNNKTNLRQPTLPASNSSIYSYPAGVINFNAQVNNENITYSVPYTKKNPPPDSLPNKPAFRRSISVENGNGVYGNQDNENVIVVKFPLGSAVKKENPPPPPPRDPQRKLSTPISSLYENSRPLSYAFEPSPQTSTALRKSEEKTNTAPFEYRNSKNIYQHSVPNKSGQALNWSKRPTSTSEDHIAMQQNNYNQSTMSNYSSEQPKRPSSVTGEVLRPDIYSRYLARPQINRVNMPNSVPRRHTQENTNPEFLYYADKTPRSRKPIHIAKTTTNPEVSAPIDSKVSSPQSNVIQRPRNASDFWRKMDSQVSQRKSFGHNRTLSDTSISGIFNGQSNNSTLNSRIRNITKPLVTNGVQENDRLKANSFRNSALYNNTSHIETMTQRVKKEEEPICYSNIDIIPMDDIRKNNHSGKNSDEDPSRGRRKSTNLEDALSELEAIYNSLGLGDEDLLDRAERRELTTPKTTEPYPFSSSDRENHFRFPSYSDYTDGASVLKKQNQFNRRSSVPDKTHDDMAYRRMNPHERPKSKDVNNLVSQASYMTSPVFGDQQRSLKNGESTDDQEPDIVLDDVVFRNQRQANNHLKIEDRQPLFGIPVGPTSPPNSDYLHVTSEVKPRSRYISQANHMTSPVLGNQQRSLKNGESTDEQEPDVVLDDVVFRNRRQANNYLKIEDPQPLFGIPLGPVSPAPNSDYLHITPEVKDRSRYIPQESPDVVNDDLAFRNLRKDRNASPLGNAAVEVLINNSSENKSMSQPSKMFDKHVIKKKKAVRSMSANIFTMIQREIDDALGLCSSRALEKAQSIPDLPDAVVEFGKSGKLPSNFRASQLLLEERLCDADATSRLTPNYDSEARTNARNNFLFSMDNKVTNRPPLSVTPDRSPKDSSSGYRKPLSPKRATQSETEDALDMMAQEANETSAKLVLALEELQKEKSPLKFNDSHKQVPTASCIEEAKLLKMNNNISKLNFLNDRSSIPYNENATRISIPKPAERRNIFEDNDYVNIDKFEDFSKVTEKKNDNPVYQGRGRSTEDSLIEISNQLKIAGNKIKSNSDYLDNFEDEGAKLRLLAKQCDINLNKNSSHAENRQVENKIMQETKFVPFEQSFVRSHPSSYDDRFHVSKTSIGIDNSMVTKQHSDDSKMDTLDKMQSFDDLRKGISDLLEDISHVTDKFSIKNNDQSNSNERNGKESPVELSSRDDESEKSRDNRGSPEYNSSEELAMIFNLTKEDASKASDQQKDGAGNKSGEKDSHLDLNSPRLVNTVNQNLRKVSKDETNQTMTAVSKPPATIPRALTTHEVPWRVNRRQSTADSASKGACDDGLCSSKRRSWYRDPDTLMLACSYTLICTQQLDGLDFLTLLGIVLAMISIIAMLII